MNTSLKLALGAMMAFFVLAAETTIAATVAAPVFTPPGGTHNDLVDVAVTSATAGATIYYTTDGTDPTEDSEVYDPDLPLQFDQTTTLKAIAVKAGDTDSTITTATFTIVDSTPPITVANPSFTPAPGSYNDLVQVTMTCATAAATISYTTDGSDPSDPANPNVDIFDPDLPLELTDTTTVKAYATKDSDDTPSAVVTGVYTIVDTTPAITVATPVFSPVAGTYNDLVQVTITSSTDNATIYYTTDGTDPTTASTEYDPFTPIELTSTTTLKAIAVRKGDFDSAIATATYTVVDNPAITVAAPTFSPQPGRYFDYVEVSMSTKTPGATIYYTTDGTDPVVNGDTTFQYYPEFPEFLLETTTIKAMAVRAGDTDSAISSATYKVLPLPAPKVKLKGPKKLAVTKPTVILKGTATYADEINYQIGKKKAKKAKGTDKWSIKLKLNPGKTVVSIFGVGPYENSKPFKVTINYAP